MESQNIGYTLSDVAAVADGNDTFCRRDSYYKEHSVNVSTDCSLSHRDPLFLTQDASV